LCQGVFRLTAGLFFLILLPQVPLFLRYQVTVDLPHVAHGGGTHHHTGSPEYPSHRQLACRERMLHAAHDGFDGGTQIVSVRKVGLGNFSPQSTPQRRLIETQAGEGLFFVRDDRTFLTQRTGLTGLLREASQKGRRLI